MGQGGAGRKVGLLAAVLAAATIATASSASAAVTIGETFNPPMSCGSDSLFMSASPPPPAVGYAAPSAGVITSWSFHAGASAPSTMRLKVARGTPNALTTVGRSEFQPVVANQLNTFSARVAVQAGDVIGQFATIGGPSYACLRAAAVGYTFSFLVGVDPAPGSTDAYGATQLQLDLSARLEPDADNDGFGDETQDQCPSDATKQVECVPPETTISKKPKKKDKKKKAKFEFTSSEAGSTFECSLDGGPFAPCTSPHTVKVKKKGKHTFAVRARDVAGNLDATPATYSWKYKPKKKK